MNATVADTHFRVRTPAELMRAVWGKLTAKRAAAAAGKSHRTTEKWLAGDGEPTLSVALQMAAHDEVFCAELVRELAEITRRIEGKNHV